MSSTIEESGKRKIFINRLVLFAIIQMVLVVLLLGRFVFLQVISYDTFKNKSENNNIKFLVIPPLRGNFLDRNNVKLTNNRKSYDVFLYRDKKNATQEEDINNIIEILKLDDEKQSKMRKQLKKNQNQTAISILNNLTWEKLADIETNSYKLKNISIEEGNIREYLYPEEAAHITGYVSNPNDKDIAQFSKTLSKDILLNPNFKIGKNGLELIFNFELTGKSGYKKIEVNVNNTPLREIEKKTPEAANDIRLTIDINLQKYIFSKVKDKRAGIVVLDIKTGEVLAMVSSPSFNGNQFVDGISNNYWNELLNDPRKPLYNKTITGLYAPGSTFKPIVALAALETDVIDEKKTYRCPGKIKLGKIEMSCWVKKHGHGTLNVIEALERSCNVFFINLGINTGINKIFEVASSLGIGENFDLKLNEFRNGVLPNKDWKYKIYKDVWVKGDTANISIGQGFLLVNPLQMAVMVSRIANNGYAIKPYLIYNDVEKQNYNKIVFELDPLFKQKNVDIVKKGMYEVVNGKHGTVSWIKFKNKEKYGIAGKTGTAQVIATNFREEMEEQPEGIEEQFKNHGWFVGFAPFENPKYGIAVLIEHGGGGSVAAAPVAVDILRYAIDNDI
ncbi:MAG: penicillin-binding protein 2 [Rickettsiales bacterium]|nr:penicillin-binding protein 2 [Rickettsiales bacterium]